jgi:hypothetical protein
MYQQRIKSTYDNLKAVYLCISRRGFLVKGFQTAQSVYYITFYIEWRSVHFDCLNTRMYEGRLRSSETHLITRRGNFVQVRWRSLSRSTSLGKRCTSYNAPPTSRRKRAADHWSLRNFLPRSFLFMVGKAQKSHGARSELYGGCSDGVPPIHFFQAEYRLQLRSRPMLFVGFSNHEKGAQR